MPKPIHLQATPPGTASGGVQAIQRALSDHGGWVLDYRQFSNAAVSISFEIPVGGLPGMVEHADDNGGRCRPEKTAGRLLGRRNGFSWWGFHAAR